MEFSNLLKKSNILFGGTLSLATLSIMNTAYTNILDSIKSELFLNYTWTGALMSSYFIGYTLGQIPWGILSDKYGSRRIMSLSVFGVSFFTLLFGYSSNIILAALFRFLSGLLGAGIFVPSVKLVSCWFNSEERGTVLGILNIGGSIGLIAASWFVPILTLSNGWRLSLMITGMLGLASAIICFFLLRDNEDNVLRKTNFTSLPLGHHNFWYLNYIQFIRLGSFYTLLSWMPLLLKEEYGFNIVATSSAMSLLNLAGIVSNPAGGVISDRVGEKRVLLVGFSSLALFLLFLTFNIEGSLVFLLVFMLGWFINFSRSPSFSIIPRLFGVEIAGSVSGINNTFASLGALILPFTLGYVRDVTNSYNIGWYSIAVLSIIAAFLMYLIRVPISKNL